MVFIQKRLRNGDVIILPITIEEATNLIEQNEKDEKKEREKEEYEERRYLTFLQISKLATHGGPVSEMYLEGNRKYFANKKHTFYGVLFKNTHI